MTIAFSYWAVGGIVAWIAILIVLFIVDMHLAGSLPYPPYQDCVDSDENTWPGDTEATDPAVSDELAARRAR